jgi:hypothetical protein
MVALSWQWTGLNDAVYEGSPRASCGVLRAGRRKPAGTARREGLVTPAEFGAMLGDRV